MKTEMKKSIDTYLKFINEYPNNNLISKAYVELGSIFLKEKTMRKLKNFY